MFGVRAAQLRKSQAQKQNWAVQALFWEPNLSLRL